MEIVWWKLSFAYLFSGRMMKDYPQRRHCRIRSRTDCPEPAYHIRTGGLIRTGILYQNRHIIYPQVKILKWASYGV